MTRMTCVFLILLIWAAPAAAENYHPGDVAVISKIITTNDAEGKLAEDAWKAGQPDTWPAAVISENTFRPGFGPIPAPAEGQGNAVVWTRDQNGVRWKDGRVQILVLHQAGLSGTIDLTGLSGLEILVLDFNNLSAVQGLPGLTGLKAVDLSINRELNDLGDLSGLTDLEYLHAGVNKLTRLEGLGRLTKLKSLQVNVNQLTGLEGLGGLINLTELNVFHNQLTGLEDLGGLTKLTRLSVGHNRLTELKGLERLNNLELLDISDNPGLDGGFLYSMDTGHLSTLSFSGGQLPAFSLAGIAAPKMSDLAVNGTEELQSLDLDGRPLDTLVLQGTGRPGEIKNPGPIKTVFLMTSYGAADTRALLKALPTVTGQWVIYPRDITLGDAAPGLKAGRGYTPDELSPTLAADYNDGGPRTRLYAFHNYDNFRMFSFADPPDGLATVKSDQGRLTFHAPGDYYLVLEVRFDQPPVEPGSGREPAKIPPLRIKYEDVFKVEAGQ